MDNEITIDVNEILALPDGSIDDAKIIRQIGLATTKWEYVTKEVAHQLCRKIKKGFEVAALYPHVMKSFDIKPELKEKLLKELDKDRYSLTEDEESIFNKLSNIKTKIKSLQSTKSKYEYTIRKLNHGSSAAHIDIQIDGNEISINNNVLAMHAMSKTLQLLVDSLDINIRDTVTEYRNLINQL